MSVAKDLLALGVLGALLVSGCNKKFDDGFKGSYRTNFASSCTTGAVKEGAPEERAKPLCECLASYMVDHHDVVTLTKFSASPDSAKTAVEEGVKICQEAEQQR